MQIAAVREDRDAARKVTLARGLYFQVNASKRLDGDAHGINKINAFVYGILTALTVCVCTISVFDVYSFLHQTAVCENPKRSAVSEMLKPAQTLKPRSER